MSSRILRVAAAFACALAGACGGKAVLDPPVEPAVCTEPLCIDPDGQARLAETTESLAVCVPGAPGQEGDPSGLRVGAIAVSASTDETVSLTLTLVNVLPNWVGTYPGLRLAIAHGNVTSATMDFGQFYGITGCTSQSADVSLAWSVVDGATLTAQATNNLGAELLDSIVFSLNR